MRWIIMGPAGAGKGTIAARIIDSYNIAYIASGNMFRNEIALESDLGKKAKKYIESGKLVPDDITIAMVLKRLREDDCQKGFLLDGFPRTISQAEALQAALAKEACSIELVINLLVTYETVAKRILGRRICPNCDAIYNVFYSAPRLENICDRCDSALIQRSDDAEEQLKVRLQEHQNSTAPVLEFYRNLELVVDVDATASPQEVWDEVLPFLEGQW